MSHHPAHSFLHDGVVLVRRSLEHTDLLVEVDQVRFAQLVLDLARWHVRQRQVHFLELGRRHLLGLDHLLRFLLTRLGVDYSLVVDLAQLQEVQHHELADLHCLLCVAQSLLVAVELAEQSADLHVHLALVLQLLELHGWTVVVELEHIGLVYLSDAGVQTQAALLDGSHLLEAQRHVVHCALNQKPVARVQLEHQPVHQRLRFLQQRQRAVPLVLRNEVDRRVVQLVQNQRHLVLVEVQLFRVQLLKAVLEQVALCAGLGQFTLGRCQSSIGGCLRTARRTGNSTGGRRVASASCLLLRN